MTPYHNWGILSHHKIRDNGKQVSDKIQLWRWKIKLLIGFFIIVTFSFLTVLFILEYAESTRVLRPVKIKRFVRMDDYYDELESTRTEQTDIHIIPQTRHEDIAKRTSQHDNHKYLETEPEGNIYNKIMKDLYNKSNSSPKPFVVKAEEYLDSVRSIISKKRPNVKNGRSKFLNPKGSRSSMRLKGVFGYVLPEVDPTNNTTSQSFYYSKEINNLMQSFSGNQRKENALTKKAFKSQGAPFQIPVKGQDPSKSEQPSFKGQLKKRPFTILLDIYPMGETYDYFRKEKSKLNHIAMPSRNEFLIPRGIHTTGKFPFPNERKGIIMKLNLYTKNSSGEAAEDAIHSNEHKRAKEKSFGWFSIKKEKKKEPEQCSLMALKPHGKHVTAKWKNENGEWIHAKHLSVKHFKKSE